jgi:hypothetical protein
MSVVYTYVLLNWVRANQIHGIKIIHRVQQNRCVFVENVATVLDVSFLRFHLIRSWSIKYHSTF